MKDVLIKQTCDLIKFRTTKENLKSLYEIINFVTNQFKGEKVYIKKYKSNGFPSVVITLKKEKNPKFFLNGHLDVVAADEKDFTPKVKKRRIYGRGSGDMKAGCAVMIEIMKHFSRQEKPPSLGLMLTTDEEIGGANGVGYLVRKKGYKSEIALIPDGGVDLKTIILNQKGIIHLKIKEFGKAAHGAKPFLGENAIDGIIKKYLEIRKVVPELKGRRWSNSMNLGRIEGGEATNKVPDKAEIFLDIRYTKKGDKDRILDRISQITKNYEIIGEGDPFIQNKNDYFLKNYQKIAEDVLGGSICFSRVEGASDARFFSEVGVPVIITKIGCDNIHGDGEFVDVNEMVNFYKILEKFINQI